MRKHRKNVGPKRPAQGKLVLVATLALGLSAVQAAPLPDPITDADFPSHTDAKVHLGKVLFYDKILSGNRNISCATCHHSLTDTGDGLSLPVGEGGAGLGVARDTGAGTDAIHERVPRNAPFVFNLGAFEFEEMFHDGRVEYLGQDADGNKVFSSPAGDALPPGLDSPLAAQAMFPPTSGTEMAGQGDENPVARAAAAGDVTQVWHLLTKRLRRNPEYVTLFKAAYPGEIRRKRDIMFVHAANAIAAYEGVAFRAINSPFDRYLRDGADTLSPAALRGMDLFYGDLAAGGAGCADCHAGPLQTDHGYHAIAMPQIGPGKGDPGVADLYGDFGREQVTLDPNDRYKFRTPSLRNTALTGPWGHDGAYNSLEATVRHHLDPVNALESYDRTQAVLPPRTDLDAIDFVHHDEPLNRADIAAASEITPIDLTDGEVADLVEFLHALTDPASLDLRDTVPSRVPSGLPLAD
jgi:cytochrome c peroxidase